MSIRELARMISEMFTNVELEEYSEIGYAVYVNGNENEIEETMQAVISFLQENAYNVIEFEYYENSYTLQNGENRFYVFDETIEEW